MRGRADQSFGFQAYVDQERRLSQKMLPEAQYFNCDLPSTQLATGDPELFWSNCEANRVVVLDQMHRLNDPSTLLKIAADEYPHLRVTYWSCSQ